jgi:acetyl-CoA acetyltransferase
MGNALQTSGDAIYGARHVGLKAGVPVETPALTVNRPVRIRHPVRRLGRQMIRLGESRLAIAGGMENMTQAPQWCGGARSFLPEGSLEDCLMLGPSTPMWLYLRRRRTTWRACTVTREAMDPMALLGSRAGARGERGVFREETSRSTSRRGARRAGGRTITCGRRRR